MGITSWSFKQLLCRKTFLHTLLFAISHNDVCPNPKFKVQRHKFYCFSCIFFIGHHVTKHSDSPWPLILHEHEYWTTKLFTHFCIIHIQIITYFGSNRSHFQLFINSKFGLGKRFLHRVHDTIQKRYPKWNKIKTCKQQVWKFCHL